MIIAHDSDFRCLLTCLVLFGWSIGHTRLAPAAETSTSGGSRWALLIGVDNYSKLRKLSCCAADAKALRDTLVLRAGYQKANVTVLLDPRTCQAVLAALETLAAKAGPQDLILVSFSGHGVEQGGEAFLCPADADPAAPHKTMVAVKDLYKSLAQPHCRAASKAVIIDACRGLAEGGRGAVIEPMTVGFQNSLVRGSEGLWVLSSCSSGQASHEHERLGHGVFLNYVIEGLSGRADRKEDGYDSGNHNDRIEGSELFSYASKKTEQFVRTKLHAVQTPRLCCTESDAVIDLGIRDASHLPRSITNQIGMQFAIIFRGAFSMGSPPQEGFENERPKHMVWITEDFYLGVTEVTQAQYKEVIGTNPSYFAQTGGGAARVAGRDTSKFPVERVNWSEACEFCRKLAEREGLPAGTYRLPTEAEWEYAARDGTDWEYGPAGTPVGLAKYAWYDDNSGDRTHEVGRPDAKTQFGLFDMQGNVAEWCQDWFDPQYYLASPREDPPGPDHAGKQNLKVLRGGAWCLSGAFCRVADRNSMAPEKRGRSSGFRVVRSVYPSGN